MKMKLIALNYQRNGVGGEPFYSVLIENLQDTKGLFLATFLTKTKDDIREWIDWVSCRVVMIGETKNHYENWRGDVISEQIQSLLNEEMAKVGVKDWFDLSVYLESKITGKAPFGLEYLKTK